MIGKKFKKSESALAIVAHPDDETIWMGGFIILHPELDWTIFSLCRGSDPDRAPKFLRVCEFYGARPLIADLEDDGLLSLADSLPVIRPLIEKNIGRSEFCHIFTHGQNGEYGHPRHRGVNLTVTAMVKNGEINTKNLYYFHYEKIEDKDFSPLRAAPHPDLSVKLSAPVFKKKKEIMTGLYGFSPEGIDAGYCTNPEAFRRCWHHGLRDC